MGVAGRGRNVRDTIDIGGCEASLRAARDQLARRGVSRAGGGGTLRDMTVSRSSAAPRPVNFGRALLACLPATLVLGAIMVVGSIPTADSSRTLGRAVGMMIFSALLGALVVWLIARRRSWRFWKVVVLGSVLVLVLQLLTVSSQLS
jgi:hypothetical protein